MKDDTAKEANKVIKIGGTQYEVIGENKFTARIFEAVAARSSAIMEALDEAKINSFGEKEGVKEKPTYKHTILLGRDDKNKNLRASIAVFPNRVFIQTLRET